ncbi:MAG: hypothetical protein Q8L74_12995 [Nitrospirota bacterium]|nr:hypothetical protein [Nitrospirota bacterium]
MSMQQAKLLVVGIVVVAITVCGLVVVLAIRSMYVFLTGGV